MNPLLKNKNYDLQVQGFQAPPVSTMMNAASIQSPSTLNLVPATLPSAVPNIANIPTDTITTPGTLNTATTSTPVAPVQDPTSNAWKSAFDKVTGLFSQKGNKESDLATSTEAATAPYTQQLNEINTQIKMQQANALANQEKALQSGETSGFASREAQNVARTDAIETLKLSAIQAGLQGNIALAEKHTENAINAKYADINKQIEDTKTNIYNNYDSFTAAEKKKADQTLLRLDAQDAFAKQNQDNEKTSAGIIQTAIKQSQENGNPVPTLVLQQASKLTDPTQVTSLLAPYLKDSLGIQAKIDAHKLANAQLEKLDADTKKVIADSQLDLPSTIGTVDLKTPEGRNTGTLISLLTNKKVDTGAKTQIANVLGVLNASKDLASQRQNGKFEGISPLQGVADFIFPEFLSSNESTQNRGYLDAINLKVQQWASGASLTKQQTDQVNNLTPKKTDSDEKVMTKLNNLTNFMLTQVKSQVQSQGINYTPETVDLFVTKKRIDSLSPEQKKELQDQGLL